MRKTQLSRKELHKALMVTKYPKIPVSSDEELEEIEEPKRPTKRKSKMSQKEISKARMVTNFCRIMMAQSTDDEEEDKQQEGREVPDTPVPDVEVQEDYYYS